MLSVSKGSYGRYASSNYGVNTLYFDVNGLTVYFSYDTVIAFNAGNGIVCSENVWSTTTGKHLNWLQPDHDKRLAFSDFEKCLQVTLEEFGTTVN